MPLSQQDRKQFKAIGHHLKPVLIFGGNGLTENFIEELNKRLEDHELIKVKVKTETREDRAQVIDALCKSGQCELVQSIGNVALLYRAAKKPSPKLSNLLRFANG